MSETISTTSSLASKTPAELREIAARYHLKISGKSGNTVGRVAFWLLCLLLLFFLIASGVGKFLFFIPVGPRVALAVTIWALSGLAMTAFLFLVPVGQLIGVKSLNNLTKTVHVFTQGLNIRFPWETVTDLDYISLRSGTTNPGVTFLSKDGVMVGLRDSVLRWRVFPPLLLLYVSHSEATITKGADEIVTSALSDKILGATIAEIRTPEMLARMRVALIETLEDDSHRDTVGSTFEEQYGVTVEAVALGVLVLAPDYEEALAGNTTMEIYTQKARQMVEASRLSPEAPPTITFAEAMNLLMINAKEQIKKDIREVNIKVDPTTAEALQKMGTAGAAAVLGTTDAGPHH